MCNEGQGPLAACFSNFQHAQTKVTMFIIWLCHRIRIHRRATRVGAFEVFEAAHVALRTLLAFSQPVNCIFWPIGMLNWLVAASKLHKHRETCCTAEWPFYSFLILWLCCEVTLRLLEILNDFDVSFKEFLFYYTFFA